MTMNRVQFQAGLSMAEFLERYGSDERCEAALIAARWPSRFACPQCGGGQLWDSQTSFQLELADGSRNCPALALGSHAPRDG